MMPAIRQLKEEGRLIEFNDLVPYAKLVGFESFEQNGCIITALRHRNSNIGNPLVPAIHGGVIGALLEHAAILEILNQIDLEDIPKTINISIDYLRPSLGFDTYAKAIMVKQGRRIVNMRIEAWQKDESRLVAAAHAHFLVG